MFDSRIAAMVKKRSRLFWRYRCKTCCVKFVSERGKIQHLRLSRHTDIFLGWPQKSPNLKWAPELVPSKATICRPNRKCLAQAFEFSFEMKKQQSLGRPKNPRKPTFHWRLLQLRILWDTPLPRSRYSNQMWQTIHQLSTQAPPRRAFSRRNLLASTLACTRLTACISICLRPGSL